MCPVVWFLLFLNLFYHFWLYIIYFYPFSSCFFSFLCFFSCLFYLSSSISSSLSTNAIVSVHPKLWLTAVIPRGNCILSPCPNMIAHTHTQINMHKALLSCLSNHHTHLHDISLWCHHGTNAGMLSSATSSWGSSSSGSGGRASDGRQLDYNNSFPPSHMSVCVCAVVYRGSRRETKRRNCSNLNNLNQTEFGFLYLFIKHSLSRFTSCLSVFQQIKWQRLLKRKRSKECEAGKRHRHQGSRDRQLEAWE